MIRPLKFPMCDSATTLYYDNGEVRTRVWCVEPEGHGGHSHQGRIFDGTDPMFNGYTWYDPKHQRGYDDDSE